VFDEHTKVVFTTSSGFPRRPHHRGHVTRRGQPQRARPMPRLGQSRMWTKTGQCSLVRAAR
jgi:hypothetical protein